MMWDDAYQALNLPRTRYTEHVEKCDMQNHHGENGRIMTSGQQRYWGRPIFPLEACTPDEFMLGHRWCWVSSCPRQQQSPKARLTLKRWHVSSWAPHLLLLQRSPHPPANFYSWGLHPSTSSGQCFGTILDSFLTLHIKSRNKPNGPRFQDKAAFIHPPASHPLHCAPGPGHHPVAWVTAAAPAGCSSVLTTAPYSLFSTQQPVRSSKRSRLHLTWSGSQSSFRVSQSFSIWFQPPVSLQSLPHSASASQGALHSLLLIYHVSSLFRI